MKKLCTLVFAAVFASLLGAAETKLYFDKFEFPLVRTHWLKIEPHTAEWTKDMQLPASGIRWRLRFNGEKSAFKTLTVTNSKGKVIFQDNSCQKATWINLTGSDTYTLKATGKPNSKVSYIVLDTYDNEDKTLPGWRSTLMPSWRFLRIKHAPAPDGGVALAPAGDVPSIYTLLSGLTSKYRAEFNVVSPTAQKVKILVSWQSKTKKGRDMISKELEVAPNTPATVSAEFAPASSPVSITLVIGKELTAKSFNLFEVK